MYLDFKEISKIPFKDVLDYLGIVYQECRDGIKGIINETPFIVTTGKNMFFCPHMKEWKGGIINFTSIYRGVSLVDAAKELKGQFLDKPKEPKRGIPELKLEYCPFLRMNQVKPETSDLLEAGMCSQRSIMAGKICFKMYSADGSECVGYVGYEKDGKVFVPPAYKHEYIFNLHRVKTNWAIVAKSPLAACQLHTAGYTNVVGLTRESLTDSQVALLSSFKRLVFYDCGPAAILKMASHVDVRIADDEYLGTL